MSWFDDAFGDKGKGERIVTSRKIFEGMVSDADKLVTEGIEKLMNFAMNTGRTDGQRAFSEVGDKMVFEMKGVVLGVPEDPSVNIGAGDFEIEIRRVS